MTRHEERETFRRAVRGEADAYERPSTETHDDRQLLIKAVTERWVAK
jgi:hypothetical protein